MTEEMIEISFTYKWVNVLEVESIPYKFPNPISPFIKKTYKHPAIYRWKINDNENGDTYYIGEAIELCPQRLNGYLNPGPSQWTNKRLNALFKDCLSKGCQISFDFLVFTSINLNGREISRDEFRIKHYRKLLESMFVADYKSRGIPLLNM